LRLVVCNLLRAHAGAYRIIHRHCLGARVGIAMAYPALEAWGSRGLSGIYEKMAMHFARKVIYQAWDQSVYSGRIHPFFGKGRIEGLRDSTDFCGINYYFRVTPRFSFRHARTGFLDLAAVPDGVPTSDFGWQVWPEGLRRIIDEVWGRFQKPILITENGIADRNDVLRSDYIVAHLQQVHQAIEAGIPIQGYFHWSLMDNFEWNEGFEMKFGLVEINFEDPALERKPRPSALLYRDIININGLSSEINGLKPSKK
jgi:beta-glucosidase/6-phospho-beta-glucosidase/beta-galactosidase